MTTPTVPTQALNAASSGTGHADTLFRAGDLSGAIAAATAAVKAAPADPAPRLLLAELSLFAGDLNRVETLIAAMASIDPGTELIASEFRQLLRAEVQRRAVLEDGASPEFVSAPTASQQESLRALMALRSGDLETAAQAAYVAEEARPPVTGRFVQDGVSVAFDDFRDADDILCGSLEMLTTTGKCFWVPMESVVEMSFHAPRRPRDLFWRRATVVVRDGPQGDIYVPAIYYPAGQSDALRLGRETEWSGGDEPDAASGPVRGSGQRVFVAGDEALDILQATELTFG